MDYEKKYNEALERARKAYNAIKPENYGARKIIENAFPELAESEDERIRRTLVEYFGPKVQLDFVRGVPIQKIRDWLEKQKESLHIPETCKDNADSFTDEDEIHRKWILEYLYNGLRKSDEQFKDQFKSAISWLEKQKEQKPLITGNDFGWIDELKHDLKHPEELDEKVQEVLKKRQKPVERSLEDDHIIGFVYDLLNEIEWKDNWAMSKKECLERLKSLRPVKQEWSKEDERKRQACISTINEVVDYERERWEDYNPGKPYRPIMKYDEQIDWLKSLRPPQYCENCRLKKSVQGWKPSEKQMEALDKALYYVPEEIGIPIAEIYGHFNKMKKKLM